MSSVEPPDLLQYLPKLRVIICLSCQYALQPKGISRHLKDIHHILRSRKRAFVEYVSAFDLADTEEVMKFGDNLKQFPVPILPVLDGLRCHHGNCYYLCVTEKRMKAHWSLAHHELGQVGIDWSSVPLQTFFRGNSLKYFTGPIVPVPPTPSLTQHQLNSGSMRSNEHALLRHYITSTSLTLAYGVERSSSEIDSDIHDQDAQLSVWREAVPQLAREHRFLMQGVLACAALHLAHLMPSKKESYIINAAEYQDLAMAPFREAMDNLSAVNCNAVFAFIHILAILSLSLQKATDHLLIASSEESNPISDWLSLMRAGCSYVHSVRESVETGPLRAFLCDSNKQEYAQIHGTSRLPLVERLLHAIPSTDSEEAWSTAECKTYSDAVHELGRLFAFAEQLGTRFNLWEALRAWPMIISLDFFRLLQSGHPCALIPLANYTRVLRRFDGKWYFQAGAKTLLGCILARLDSKWHAYADWSSQT